MENDDALYGIFNAYSSDDDGSGSSRSKRRRKDRDVDVNLTKPVKFVFTSTVILNQEVEMEKDNNNPINNAHGLGATDTTGFGLGFTNTNSNYVIGDDDDDFLSTEFGRKIKEGARRRRNEKEKLKLLKQQKKRTMISQSWDGALGEFEKHTKGIGSKMLKNMGYKGGGLGKNEQGILTPIEPKLRPKNMGMGFNDYKETTTRDAKTSSVMSCTTATTVAAKHTRLSWKKNNANNTVKYLSAKDLIDEKRAKEEEEGVEGFLDYKVIDKRGPQVRILSNLENLNVVDQDQEMEDDDSVAPEVRHNVGLTLDLVENDIIKIDRDLRNEGERGMRLMEEKARVEAEAAGQKQQLDRWEDLTTVLDRLGQESSVGTLTLISLANDMSDLQRRYTDDYKLCNLSWIACSLALPLFTRIFESWDPLRNPSHGLDVVSSWKTLLSINGGEGEGEPYTQLVFEVLVPRIAGSNTWQAKDPEPMVRFLECWEELLPPRVRDAILNTIVFPKLKNAVNLWEPCQDTVPIHLWVHPWLPVLGRKLEDLYPTIRFKLSNVLGAWHPSDPSAYAVLSPWKKVFDFASWEELMSKFIVPKLQLVLQDLFQVNIHPVANQRLDPYIWVMSWAGAIPVHLMVGMMVRFFFPNWLNVLKSWLVSNPNFEQVLIWYKGWKELIPEELRADESIRQHLNYGLAMMDQAAEGMEVVLPRLNAKADEAEQRQFEEEKKAAAGGRGGGIGGDEETMMSLKDVVAAHAQQHGLMFKPKPGRMHNGYQIYGFGHVSVIVDSRNQKVYAAHTEGNWSLVSLEKLLDMHKTRAMRRYPHLPHRW